MVRFYFHLMKGNPPRDRPFCLLRVQGTDVQQTSPSPPESSSISACSPSSLTAPSSLRKTSGLNERRESVRAIDELLAFDDIDDDVLGGSLPATDRCRVLHRREPLRERSSPAGASSLASEAKGQKFRAARISRAQALEHCRALAKEATNLKVAARQHAAAFARCSSRRATTAATSRRRS